MVDNNLLTAAEQVPLVTHYRGPNTVAHAHSRTHTVAQMRRSRTQRARRRTVLHTGWLLWSRKPCKKSARRNCQSSRHSLRRPPLPPYPLPPLASPRLASTPLNLGDAPRRSPPLLTVSSPACPCPPLRASSAVMPCVTSRRHDAMCRFIGCRGSPPESNRPRIMLYCVATKCDMSRSIMRRAGCGGGQAESS